MHKLTTEPILRMIIILFIGVAIYLLIPVRTSPQKFNKVSADYLENENVRLLFADLDGDGVDEEIKGFWPKNSGMYTIQVVLADKSLEDQWNFAIDADQDYPKLAIGDFDRNNKKELYLFYILEGNLYMDVFGPKLQELGEQSKQVWVDSVLVIPPFKKIVKVSEPVFADLNGDGVQEVIFSAFASLRTYFPRRLYAYDLVNKQWIKSDPFGNIPESLVIFDHERDGHVEIAGSCGSPDNNQPGYEYPFSDSCCWLMVFNDRLELRDSMPYRFEGTLACYYPYPVEIGGKTELQGIWRHLGHYEKPDFSFRTKDLSDVCIIDTIPSYDGVLGGMAYPIRINGLQKYVMNRGVDHIVMLNERLEIVDSIRFRTPILGMQMTDVNQDGNDDIIIMSVDGKALDVYDFDGNELIRQEFELGSSIIKFGLTNFLGIDNFYIQADQKLIFYNCVPNPWHYLKWLILIGIWASLYLFSWMSLYLQKRAQKKKVQISDKMRMLELATIKAQLDPHFTFNALNVLNYLSSNNDQKGVERFIHHFSRMLRKQLEGSDKPAIKLSAELDFVAHYIELQKLRFDIPIQYLTDIDSTVDQNLLIPKMLIHTHVENAIKHGLLPKSEGGTIWVTAETKGKHTQLTIRDNGIGRKDSKNSKNPNSNGKGLKILDQLIELFYQLYHVKITQEFIDLKDKNEQPIGTEIRITILT